jgi:hypothetical protein
MAKHEHKSGAWFELPEDITQRQLENYEAEARKILDGADPITDALLARAALSGAFKAEFISASQGLPTRVKDIDEAPARILWWMARGIAEFIAGLKAPDPN